MNLRSAYQVLGQDYSETLHQKQTKRQNKKLKKKESPSFLIPHWAANEAVDWQMHDHTHPDSFRSLNHKHGRAQNQPELSSCTTSFFFREQGPEMAFVPLLPFS